MMSDFVATEDHSTLMPTFYECAMILKVLLLRDYGWT